MKLYLPTIILIRYIVPFVLELKVSNYPTK